MIILSQKITWIYHFPVESLSTYPLFHIKITFLYLVKTALHSVQTPFPTTSQHPLGSHQPLNTLFLLLAICVSYLLESDIGGSISASLKFHRPMSSDVKPFPPPLCLSIVNNNSNKTYWALTIGQEMHFSLEGRIESLLKLKAGVKPHRWPFWLLHLLALQRLYASVSSSVTCT